MSVCGGCGQKARHVALILPFDGAGRPLIEHSCETPWCAMGTFREQVREPLWSVVMDRLRYRVETAADVARVDVARAQEVVR